MPKLNSNVDLKENITRALCVSAGSEAEAFSPWGCGWL